MVDGKIVDRSSFRVKEGQVISINVEKSPTIAEVAKNSNTTVPGYMEVDRDNCKVTVVREPEVEEVPIDVEIIRVIEYYAR